ncbi:Membrane fusion protein, cobalt-zinc-cadmium efflux system [Candidatus Methylobacter favarea]|uniref:Membrane fusion protein, cobalt-zinc-cadmium efflux system n=1 Tax=Candidatus Methylobacter favarea TaxID=2707345 RepID=A0A8S0Y6N0_9GAMM|nr:efflux RND transporter periplasmic adaptor subunit [Candidatus Methylobacter favarea]CAA9891737.1 Membrane fusion protein, cobalt-zinc-cadmium efflux system [Candidatus Methylobacter favarea]
MSMRFINSIRLAASLMGMFLLACQPQHNIPARPAKALSTNEVVLGPESPKRGYIKEAVVELTPRPLMDPVAGKIAYDALRTARVSSPVAGRVIGSIAKTGVLVQAGDTLAELDSPELGQAQSAYTDALSDLELAKHAFQRMQELYLHGIAPRKDQEQARDNLTRARSEAERAHLKLANLGVRSGRMDNRFVLHAPLAGTITESNINPGMEVRPDLPAPLYVISDLSSLWLQMDIFEKDISLIHKGAQVLVQVPAYPGESFQATVAYIGQIVDETTRTVKVRCVLANADMRLLPSMYASVELQSTPNDLAVVVPLTALFTEDESDWVYIDAGDYHYQKRLVKAGLRLKGRAVILEGIKPGERLVVDGALLLRTEQDSEQQTGEDQS